MAKPIHQVAKIEAISFSDPDGPTFTVDEDAVYNFDESEWNWGLTRQVREVIARPGMDTRLVRYLGNYADPCVLRTVRYYANAAAVLAAFRAYDALGSSPLGVAIVTRDLLVWPYALLSVQITGSQQIANPIGFVDTGTAPLTLRVAMEWRFQGYTPTE